MNSSERSQSVSSSERSQSVSSSERSQSVNSSERSQSVNSSEKSQSVASSSSESRNILEIYYEGNVVGEVDLLRYRNYEGLVNALSNMFGGATIKYGNVSSDHYTLTYIDNDEDWMMAGDIPWHDFVSTAQKLIIT
ncbi:PREDICTED: auxin-responsive protein IAA31-like [Camelina sativa]|uniref:Auxin-responsive protein n=1 Tax=Camelina sativa TaxID=90675 RepID=A0ABM0XUU8_CAMSA|nr:PREDICTED: auxin-responsive protein IAA31-like [Camelina sativa]